MFRKLYTGFGLRSQDTPQSEPVPGSRQVLNEAGGYSFPLDDMARLQRFLVLGSAGGTYYASERKLTRENLDVVERLLNAGRGKEVVDVIVAISDAGRGVSNDPALFALARCCASDVSRYAYDALPRVARTGTHLLHFIEYVKQFRGRGRTHRRAMRAWFNDRPAESLAYQMIKYQQRDGWSQRDVLRLAHPRPTDAVRNEIYRWVVKKGQDTVPSSENGVQSAPVLSDDNALELLGAFEHMKNVETSKEAAELIKQYRLPREAVPTHHLKSAVVWEALLEEMPLEAMVRNLGVMTKNEVLTPMSSFTRSVSTRLRSQEAIRKARLHPIKILAALTTYESGKGARGHNVWQPVGEIVDALNDAFYLSFGNVSPSGKRVVLALDVSGSMHGSYIHAIPGLTARVGAAAMALVTAAVEPNYTIMAFSRGFIKVNISPKQRLDDVVRKTQGLPFSGTDCAQPMLWAMKKKVEADAFIVYTDSETWAGKIHPVQALRQYRQQFGIPAKLIVVGMTSNGFSIADPDDAGMLDCVGFDVNTPTVITEFLADRI